MNRQEIEAFDIGVIKSSDKFNEEQSKHLIDFYDQLDHTGIDNLDYLILPYLGSENNTYVDDDSIIKYKSSHKSDDSNNQDLKTLVVIKQNLYEYFCTDSEKYKSFRVIERRSENFLDGLSNFSELLSEETVISEAQILLSSIKMIFTVKKLMTVSLCDYFQGRIELS